MWWSIDDHCWYYRCDCILRNLLAHAQLRHSVRRTCITTFVHTHVCTCCILTWIHSHMYAQVQRFSRMSDFCGARFGSPQLLLLLLVIAWLRLVVLLNLQFSYSSADHCRSNHTLRTEPQVSTETTSSEIQDGSQHEKDNQHGHWTAVPQYNTT